MAANCRFEDNYTDFGFGNRINIPILKCDPPNTNAIWGIGAINPTSAVMETSSAPAMAMFGEGQATKGVGMFGENIGQEGLVQKLQPKQMEQCADGEVDTGLTCETVLSCKTEEDKSQPIKGAFGEIWGYMIKTTCNTPSSRPKKFM
jgi:hypothetical protein